MKTTDRLWKLMAMLAIVFGIAACEETDDEEGNTSKPDVPVNNSDWQTVPAKGGTIEKGDITIVFPSGTFSSDAKVAVKEAKPYKNARSKCYQVVLPKTGTNKPFTVRLKCEGSTENVLGIVQTLGMNIRSGKDITFDAQLEPSVKDDVLSFEIPEADSDGNENPFFTIGLAECAPIIKSQNTRAALPDTWVTTDEVEKLKQDSAKYNLLLKTIYNMNTYSINILTNDLGFEFPEKAYYNMPTIKYQLTNDPEYVKGTEGQFIPARFFRKLSQVYLKESQFWKLVSSSSPAELTKELAVNYETIIHETLHAITYFSYDKRYASTICRKGAAGDDWSQFDEAVGCWVEKFVGRFTFTGLNTERHLYQFVREFYPHKRNMITCMHWGYGMSVFVEFLSRYCGGNKAISNFYKQWRDGGNKDNFRADLKALLAANGVKFFDSENYYDFIYRIMIGDISSQVDYSKIINSSYRVTEKTNITDSVFNYGTSVQELQFPSKKLIEKIDSSICITQDKEGVLTRIYYTEGSNIPKIIGECEKDKPFSFEVKEFADFASKPIDSMNLPSLLLTTVRKDNKEDYSFLPSDITVEFLSDSCEINEVKAQVELALKDVSYNYKASFTFKNSEKQIKTTRMGKSLHVTCSVKNASSSTIYEGTLTFDIDDFSDDAIRNKKANIVNLKYSYTKVPTEKEKKSYHNESIEGLEIPKIPFYEGTPHQNAVWYGTRGNGVKFNNFVDKTTFYFSNGSVDDVTEHSLAESSSDYVRISIDLGDKTN